MSGLNVGILPAKNSVGHGDIQYKYFREQAEAFYGAFKEIAMPLEGKLSETSKELLTKANVAAQSGNKRGHKLRICFEQPLVRDFCHHFPRRAPGEKQPKESLDEAIVYLLWNDSAKSLQIVTWDIVKAAKQLDTNTNHTTLPPKGLDEIARKLVWLLAHPTILKNCAAYELAVPSLSDRQTERKDQWQMMRMVGKQAIMNLGRGDLITKLKGYGEPGFLENSASRDTAAQMHSRSPVLNVPTPRLTPAPPTMPAKKMRFSGFFWKYFP